MNKWMLNRVGLLNFWYYQNQTFEFANGHMLLRGANGSGKSLTMQSLFPVLLDGDISAYRLDSFGSRDRKMIDYLLGEKGVSDRDEGTGYLYLEVKRAQREEYLTIGIGLSASRGGNLNSWFFALENNQRIGFDFELFEIPRANEILPLSKKKLRKRLEGKGQIFENKKEYKYYVNERLFGFDQIEQFEELIALMINLRAPKLSKDFRPSMIYGILRDSLPKLKTDELASLSRTIEQLDGHRERLEDLQNETKELSRFARIYQDLNTERTGQIATHWQVAFRNKQKNARQYAQIVTDLQQIQQTLTDVENATKDNELQLDVLEQSIQKLSQHEGFDLVSQGENLKEQLARLTHQLEEKQVQLAHKRQQLSAYQEQLNLQLSEQDALKQELEDFLTDNEQYQDLLGFTSLDNQYSAKLRQGAVKQDYTYWLAEITKKQTHYQQSLKELRELNERMIQLQENERALGQKQQLIDELSREMRQWQQTRLSEIEKWKQAIDTWRQGIHFPLSTSDYDQLLYQMDQLVVEEITESEVFATLRHSYEQASLKIQQQRIPLLTHKKDLMQQKEATQTLITEWKSQKTPEPFRTVARKSNRQQLTTVAIPFYQAVDFKQTVAPELCHRIEGALAASGILDSLIGVEGLTLYDDRQILPQPQYFQSTLEDILEISDDTPLELRDIVMDILQSILLTETLEEAISPMVTTEGTYQIANLRGASELDYQASFIGASNQARYRHQKIVELTQQLQVIETKQQQLFTQLAQLDEQEQLITKEFAERPTGTEVFQAITYCKENVFEHKAQTALLLKLQNELQAVQVQVTAQKVRLHEKTKNDNFGLTIIQYEEALMYLNNYQENVRDAYSSAREIQLKEQLIKQTQLIMTTHDEDVTILMQDSTDLFSEQRKTERLYQNNLEQQKIVNVVELQQRLASSKADYQQRKQQKQIFDKQKNQLIREESAKEVTLKTLGAQQEVYVFHEAYWQALLLVKSQVSQEELADFAKKNVRDLNSKRLKELEGKMINQFNYLKNQLQNYDPRLINQTGFEMDNEQEALISNFGNLNHYKEVTFQFEGRQLQVVPLLERLNEQQLTLKELLKTEDEQLFKRVILESVGTILRKKIETSMLWVDQMNHLLKGQRELSNLVLSISWKPLVRTSEKDLGTKQLVSLLQKQTELLTEQDRIAIAEHFQEKVTFAQEQVQQNPEERNTLFQAISQVLDYRNWFEFELHFKRANEGFQSQTLSDKKFNQFSGGEKALSMYLPLFTAIASRYRDARGDSLRVITLDEAFAGIDDDNIDSLFNACEQLEFNYVMNSQALFGDYPSVSALMIYELLRPQNINLVTAISYYWNGKQTVIQLEGADNGS